MRAVCFGILCVLLSGVMAANAGSPQKPTPEPMELVCLESTDGVTWMRWHDNQPTLDRWCTSVGPPVYEEREAADEEIDQLLVLSWNVHVGGGRLEDLLSRLLQRGADTRTGLVVLVQEAFRAGAAVPGTYPADLRVPSAIRPRRPAPDIAAIAEQFGLSVAYVPSMRNGSQTEVAAREDRGNAVLSTEPLNDIKAIELPFGKQRRVAVAATVTPRRDGAEPMRVIATHFDTNGARVPQSEALAARLTEFGDLDVIVGGDFNARNGHHDRTVLTVGNQLPLLSCGTGRTNRWPMRLDVLAFFVGRLDFMFATHPRTPGPVRSCETLQDSYDSDHLPVLLTIGYGGPPGLAVAQP